MSIATSMVSGSLPRTRRPARKAFKAGMCFNESFRGYTHHCSPLLWSERQYGPTGMTCADPYKVGSRDARNACK